MVTLTRLLYAYDEIVLNLMFSILEKKNFEEVIFWTTELFHSGFRRELSDILWSFYYDFYALYSSVPFYKLNSKITKFNKKQDIYLILECFYMLFQSEPYCEVFISTKMLKFKKVRKIKNFENLFKIIELTIKNKKIFYAINYLKSALEQDEKTTIEYYNRFIKKINNKNVTLFKKKSNRIFAELLNHLFKYTNLNISKIKKKRVKINSLTDKHKEYYNKLISNDCKQTDILQKKRHYGINDITGAFQLKRDELNMPISEAFWYHWEYYSKETPFWREKYEKYSVKWKDKNILFENDNKLEEFYENNSYDIDELPFDISNKSIKTFDKNINTLDFIYKYFKIINLPLEKNKIDIKRRILY